MQHRNRWDSGFECDPVAEINLLMLQILRAAAATERETEPRLVSELRPSWRSLDGNALQRLARCPFVLLDAGFAAPERWEALGAGMTHGGVMDGGALRGYFGGAVGAALLRRTLSLAWHVARSSPLNARMMLGMSGDCAERIGASGLMHLESLAEQSPAWITPRWEGAAPDLAADDPDGGRRLGCGTAASSAARSAADGRSVVTCMFDACPVDPRTYQDLQERRSRAAQRGPRCRGGRFLRVAGSRTAPARPR